MIESKIKLDINQLNHEYSKLSVYKRVEQLYKDFDENEIMLTSSFAATSAFLLKVFSDINNKQVVYFIDTGYHFRETLVYKDYLTELYNLNVVSIKADEQKHKLTSETEMWLNQPNRCCHYNKVMPLDELKENYTIWVSGLMRWQSDFRATLNYFEKRETITKFYPLLDINFEERDRWIMEHHLPFHPLKSKGYSSIGCSHCTVPGKNRSGRWNNSPKTECGLHL